MLQPAVLDNEQLDALRTLQQPGEPDVLAMVFEEYRQELREQMRRIRQALAACDARALGRAAHALKSGSAALGATTLAAICAEIEAICNGGEAGAEVEACVTRADAEYARVLRALDAVECV